MAEAWHSIAVACTFDRDLWHQTLHEEEPGGDGGGLQVVLPWSVKYAYQENCTQLPADGSWSVI